MYIVFHQIFYADPINQFTAKLDEQNFGVWVNYFISLHYEMFIIDNVAIKCGAPIWILPVALEVKNIVGLMTY